MNILIIREDHLGDLILTTPLFRALSRAGHRVTVAARRSSLAVLEQNPHVSQLVALEDLAPNFPKGILTLGRGIRKLKPDLVLIPHAKPRSLLLGIRSGFCGKVIAMWGGIPSRLLLCHSLRSGLPAHLRHYSEIMLDLAREMDVALAGLQPEIFLSEEERSAAKSQRQERFGTRKIVIVHPGCAGNACNLPPSVYVEVVSRLLESTDVGIVLAGIASEREKFRADFARFVGNPRVWNVMGELNIRQYAAFIAEACALLIPSTGPLHLASALGVPTVSPFCQRAGLCHQIWENLGAAKSVALTPPASLCAGRSGDNHCDFEQSIGAAQLLEALMQLIE